MKVTVFVRLCRSFGLGSGKGDATTDERVVFAECHFSGGSGHVGDVAPLGRGLKGPLSGGAVLIVPCVIKMGASPLALPPRGPAPARAMVVCAQRAR